MNYYIYKTKAINNLIYLYDYFILSNYYSIIYLFIKQLLYFNYINMFYLFITNFNTNLSINTIYLYTNYNKFIIIKIIII